MKLTIVLFTMLFILSCNNPGSDRNDQKQDVEVSYPTTGNGGQTNKMDTSSNDVQDSSTTVGYDTSAVRKN